jgi:phosphotransferase system HPr-like phosphotransfer protein
MIRGWAEIAKLMALGAPEPVKVDLSVQGEIKMRQMNELSDAELVKIITAGHAA